MQALKSLRKGIEDYDQRRGWRGPITNKLSNKNWKKIIPQYKLDPTLDWQLVEIISLVNNEIKFKTIYEKKDNITETLTYKNLKWSIPKKKLIKDVKYMFFGI